MRANSAMTAFEIQSSPLPECGFTTTLAVSPCKLPWMAGFSLRGAFSPANRNVALRRRWRTHFHLGPDLNRSQAR